MIITRLINLPLHIKGMVVLDENGDYNVYVNALLTKEQQEQAYIHEMAHIESRHFQTDKSISDIESEARNAAKER